MPSLVSMDVILEKEVLLDEVREPAGGSELAKHKTAKDTMAVLCTTDITGVPSATARNPTTATAATCRATSSAFIPFRAALQLLHCATCDQYLSTPQNSHSILRCSKLQVTVEKNGVCLFTFQGACLWLASPAADRQLGQPNRLGSCSAF